MKKEEILGLIFVSGLVTILLIIWAGIDARMAFPNRNGNSHSPESLQGKLPQKDK